MEIIRGLLNVKQRHQGCVITIGNFDGVHTGHQVILAEVTKKAKSLSVPSMLICFEPQPREFFDVYEAPARLTRFREKVDLLTTLGIDYVLCFKFDEATRSMSAARFVEMLAVDLAVRVLFVGDDFQFGHDRAGTFADLEKAGDEHGFEITNQYTIVLDSERISSTRIRECLAKGDFELARRLLGYDYSITGKVVYGRQIGRTLQVPTANIQLHRYVAPISGVFAVEMLVDGINCQGVANVGVRPTFNEKTPRPILEVHLFDFHRDIYGKTVKVVFRHKIREERKFDDIEALKKAIFEDIAQARAFFRS